MTATFGCLRARRTSRAERLGRFSSRRSGADCAGERCVEEAAGAAMLVLLRPYYLRMCQLCAAKSPRWVSRRAFMLAATAVAAGPALSQVDVGESSRLRSLVPASELEQAAAQQYDELLQEARSKHALA